MKRKLLAAGAALLLLAGSACASTTYVLPWSGTLTTYWPTAGCDDPLLCTTTVTPLSGDLTISVASSLDGFYTGSDVSVSVGDVGYGDWGISGPSGSWIEFEVHHGWVDMLQAGGPAPNDRGWFSVIVADGHGFIAFDTASTDPDLYLFAVVAVPEPGTGPMLLAGCALLMASAARRRATRRAAAEPIRAEDPGRD